jgi:AAA ATPase containing von willebrand factor type A (VWA) domain-like
MMRRDDEIRLGGHFGLGHGKREERRLSLREREALRRKAREAEYEDEEEEDEDLDEDEEDEEDDDEEDDDEEDEDEEDEDELDEDDDEDYDGDDDDEEDEEDDDLDDENESDEEDEDEEDYDGDEDDEDDSDEEDDGDSDEPSPAPSKPVSGSDDRDAFIAAYLAEKERELALEREATERAEKEERERQEREDRARREEQARVQAEEEEQARRAEKAEIARRAREAEDRASRAEDRLGRTRAPFNGTEGYRGIEDSLDRVSPVSVRSGGSQRESYTGREPVLSESDRALRERELALKEREIALKERELALREREQQLKSAGSHSGKSSSVSPASYTTRVINGKTVKVKDTSKKVSKPIEEPVALSQDNRSKRYEGLSDESLMKEVTAFMLRYGVKKHGIPYELMAEEFGAGLIAKLIIRGHLVRLGDSTLTCGNN